MDPRISCVGGHPVLGPAVQGDISEWETAGPPTTSRTVTGWYKTDPQTERQLPLEKNSGVSDDGRLSVEGQEKFPITA